VPELGDMPACIRCSEEGSPSSPEADELLTELLVAIAPGEPRPETARAPRAKTRRAGRSPSTTAARRRRSERRLRPRASARSPLPRTRSSRRARQAASTPALNQSP
jgi:hypothetical protein